MAKQSEATLLLKIKEVGADAIGRVSSALGSLGRTAVAVYAEISAAAMVVISAWKEQEEATNKLNRTLINNGLYTREAAKAYGEMATELSKSTTFGDEAITNAQAQAQAYLGTTAITKELTKSILDYSAATGKDLASAAEAVGKAIGTSTNALARNGIVLDENASKQEKMAAVIGQVNELWGGQAEEQAKGMGVLLQVKNAIGEVLEVMGERLGPAVQVVSAEIKKFAENIQNNKSALDGFTTIVNVGVDGLSFLKNALVTAGELIGANLGSLAGGMVQLANGQWKQAWETFTGIPGQQLEIIKNNYKTFKEETTKIDAAFVAQKKDNSAKEQAAEEEAILKGAEKQIQQNQIDLINAQLAHEMKMAQIQMHNQELDNLELMAQVARIDAQLLNEMSATEKFRLEQEKRLLLQRVNNEEMKKSQMALAQFQQQQRAADLADQNAFFSAATSLSNSKSKELAAIGKAAAITQIAIKTPPAIASSYEFGTKTGGPFLGAVLAGVAGIAMAGQAAAIAGVPLAEGGIVRATPGGVPAIIGEGGYDEAVIPLDGPNAPNMGGALTVNFNGPIMGDPSQAREFAAALDKELFKLRRDGESVAFDSRLS